MEINFIAVSQDVMRFLQSSGMDKSDYYDNEKKQAGYLRKKMRVSPGFRKLNDKEKKSYEKVVAQIIHQYTIDEEVKMFSFEMFYKYVQKMFAGKGQL